MKTNPISANIKTQSPKKRAAIRGAVITAGVMSLSEGISWIARPETMKETVKICGGKFRYAKNLAVIIGIYSFIGALANTAFFSIANKINSKKPPKAAN